MAKAKLAIETTISQDVPLEDYLKRVDLLVRGKALANALKSASKIVQKEAQKRISRSSQTGTAKKKSRKQKERDRANDAPRARYGACRHPPRRTSAGDGGSCR